jgi:hypothetical protein
MRNMVRFNAPPEIAAPVRRRAFETMEQRAAEALVLERVARHWRLGMIQMKPFHLYDGALYGEDERVVAFLEVKSRSFRAGQYPTLDFSLSKATQLVDLTDKTGVPSVIIVKVANGDIWWCKMHPKHLRNPVLVNRIDARDDWEREPCCSIPWDEFKPLGDNPKGQQ